ncbi:hypothetical protein C0992_007677 [Termitomyces sp. T32_za158]|nr:hypothetical protein C0992_007677 [Termitomyces sp. T32_za158]
MLSLSTNRQHAKRRNKRAARIAWEGHVPSKRTTERYRHNAPPIHSSLNSTSLPVANSAYQAKIDRSRCGDKRAWTLEELAAQGLSLVCWDGEKSHPIMDKGGRIIAVLVGQPQEIAYCASARTAYDVIICEASTECFQRDQTHHCRGTFPVLNVGVFHGKGTLQPINLDGGDHTSLAGCLLADQDIQRLATFASANFQGWAPNVFTHYRERLDPLWERMPTLRRNFPRSIFPMAGFNISLSVWTHRHRDVLNCPFGWCSVQALGSFDPTKGGHLILWDLGLYVEFPLGALILLPSATISHSNVPV